nr:hypothetical protein [Candidatus Microthrix sp.]
MAGDQHQGRHLRITMEELLSDSSWEFGVDPGFRRTGVEAHLSGAAGR